MEKTKKLNIDFKLMLTREELCAELIKNGYSEIEGKKIWDLSRKTYRYINDDMAKAFLNLKKHPRFKEVLINREIELLEENKNKIFNFIVDGPFNLIDMGCDEGKKARVIIKNLGKDVKLRYCPVNVNSFLVNLALQNVKESNFQTVVEYAPRVASGFNRFSDIGAGLRNNKYQKNVILLLRSLISSFDISDYLFRMNQSMLPGDVLVVGNGIRKGKRLANLETYQHPMFHQWLFHLVKLIGFEESEVEYNARFANNRLEAFYRIKKGKLLNLCDRNFYFKENDEILVAYQYKFFASEFQSFCDNYFDNVQLFVDKDEEYALVICRR